MIILNNNNNNNNMNQDHYLTCRPTAAGKKGEETENPFLDPIIVSVIQRKRRKTYLHSS